MTKSHINPECLAARANDIGSGFISPGLRVCGETLLRELALLSALGV